MDLMHHKSKQSQLLVLDYGHYNPHITHRINKNSREQICLLKF